MPRGKQSISPELPGLSIDPLLEFVGLPIAVEKATHDFIDVQESLGLHGPSGPQESEGFDSARPFVIHGAEEQVGFALIPPQMIVVPPEMEALVKAQYSWEYEDLLALIAYAPNRVPSETMVRQIVAVARAYALPLSCMSYIYDKARGGAPYVNAEGIFWRLQTDPRQLTVLKAEVVKLPAKGDELCIMRGVVQFANGQYFDDYGATSQDSHPAHSLANRVMLAVTKCKRRAGLTACGIPLQVSEEELDWREQERVASSHKTETPSPMQTSKLVANLGDLVAKVAAKGMTLDQALDKLGKKELSDIIDLDEAAVKLGLV